MTILDQTAETLPAPVCWILAGPPGMEPVDFPGGTRLLGARIGTDGEIYLLIEHGDLPMVEDVFDIPIMRIVWELAPPVCIFEDVRNENKL